MDSSVQAPAPAPHLREIEERNEPVRDVHPRIRGAWALMQLVPSPGVAVSEVAPAFTMTWQLTPLLYSWAMDPRLVPLRVLTVEPIVRQSGSIEIFVSPEYWGRRRFEENFGVRAGLRAYFPITERGDGLSWSLGASAVAGFGETSPSFDLGIHTLFGGVGLLVSAAPLFTAAPFQVALRLRYF